MAERHLPRATRQDRVCGNRRRGQPGSDARRRAGPLGVESRHCRTGREDRDHRRGGRPEAFVFQCSGFSYPAGFPKGNTGYTTPKVIVARAFPSPSTNWRYAGTPFDPVYSEHGTHVAGIAAGDFDTPTTGQGGLLASGIAPKAYLGNYKALTVPTRGFGLDGNSPEIAKAIDQAVADGMNVINLSIGEPEIEPRRDIVVRALDSAAAAGVVPVVAAGNDFEAGGAGSIGSPANAPAAITVAASTVGGDGTRPDVVAPFSSAGPTPVSLLAKPDVTAPGVDVLSSVPPNGWQAWDGTSMATPHVSGGAALLLQRHPGWTVEQVKSALASTGDTVHPDGGSGAVSVLREGGGRIDLTRANAPLILTDPTSLGWGLVRRGFSSTKQLATADTGGGSAPWSVSVAAQAMPRGAALAPLAATVVAGQALPLRLTVSRTARAGEGTGFVVLTRGSDVRRIAFWFHVEVPRLALDRQQALRGPGLYHGNTAGRPSRVASYRYPERGLAAGVPTRLGGPEQVFRLTLRRQVANFGVVVVGHSAGVDVSPRLVAGDDENRVVGYTGLPASLNPYQGVNRPEPVVGSGAAGSRRLRLRVRYADGQEARRLQLPLLGRRQLAAVDPAARSDAGRREADPLRRPRLGLRCRPVLAQREGGKRTRAVHVLPRRALHPDRLAGAGQEACDRHGLGLPGDEEHGGRRAGAPEHAAFSAPR